MLILIFFILTLMIPEKIVLLYSYIHPLNSRDIRFKNL